jgi:predicted amidohydrolase
MERPLPNYEVVPLRKAEIEIGVIQCRLRNSRPETAREDNWENIQHMGWLMGRAFSLGHKDLIVFHESPITGMNLHWSKQDWLQVAIDIPGPETEQLADLARKYDCYIAFGCYAKLVDWPGHFINMGIIIDPTGEIIMKRWKTRNLSGFADLSTTIYDVYDEYVARYGREAFFPVVRTDIGNLTFIPEVMEPEMGRVCGMKGAEIMIRYMTWGSGYWSTSPMKGRGALANHHTFRLDLQGICIASGVYGIFVNDAITPSEDGSCYDIGAGSSAIFDHNGLLLAEVSSQFETSCSATIPMADYRRRHSIPRFPKELYDGVYDDYVPKFPTNSYLETQPQSIKDMDAHYRNIARW